MYNKNMGRNSKRGFTIIEVMLFLALTGMLFAAVVVSTSGSMARQRYKDSVEDIYDILLDAYDYVENTHVGDYGDRINCDFGGTNITESPERGRSNCAVYGAMLQVFPSGEETRFQLVELVGLDMRYMEQKNRCASNSNISSTDFKSMDDFTFMKCSLANPVHMDDESHGVVANKVLLDRTSIWGSAIQNVVEGGNVSINGSVYANGSLIDADDSQFMLIIYRSPITGRITTYARKYKALGYSSSVVDYNNIGSHPTYRKLAISGNGMTPNTLDGIDSEVGKYSIKFCVKAGDAQAYGGAMRMIEIPSSASSKSQIKLYGMESEENLCNK